MTATATIPLGATAFQTVKVTRDLTVAHFHEEMPEVYGTPMMIYLMEVASAAAIAPYLPEGWVSVGVVVNVKHLSATPVGFTVTAKAVVTAVNGNEITFVVEAHDGMEAIGTGEHVRAAIDMGRFQKRMEGKSAAQPQQ